MTDHDLTIEVDLRGARAKCSCGWKSHASMAVAAGCKPVTARRWWYEHYVAKARKGERPGQAPDTGSPTPAVAERDGDPRRSV